MAGYQARRRRDEAVLTRRIHELAVRRSRYGYRRITVLLRREGWKVNRKRVHRIRKAEGPSLPLRRPRRRRMGPAGEIVNKAEYPNHVWSYGSHLGNGPRNGIASEPGVSAGGRKTLHSRYAQEPIAAF